MRIRHFSFAVASLGILSASACSSGPKKMTHEERARTFVEVANGALSEGDPVGALQALVKAEEEGVDLPEIHHMRAIAYTYRKDLEHALEEARKAVALAPNFAEAQNTLGKLLIDKGSLDEAIPHLKASVADPLYRSSFKPYSNLGILFYRRGDYTQARTNFDRAIDSNPMAACVAYYYRGHLGVRSGRLHDAIRDYTQATHRMCADFRDAHLALGIAYERSRDFDHARRKYLEIGQRFPDTPTAEQAYVHLRDLP